MEDVLPSLWVQIISPSQDRTQDFLLSCYHPSTREAHKLCILFCPQLLIHKEDTSDNVTYLMLIPLLLTLLYYIDVSWLLRNKLDKVTESSPLKSFFFVFALPPMTLEIELCPWFLT